MKSWEHQSADTSLAYITTHEDGRVLAINAQGKLLAVHPPVGTEARGVVLLRVAKEVKAAFPEIRIYDVSDGYGHPIVSKLLRDIPSEREEREPDVEEQPSQEACAYFQAQKHLCQRCAHAPVCAIAEKIQTMAETYATISACMMFEPSKETRAT